MVSFHGKKPFTLVNGIPKLPDIQVNMICNPEPRAPTVNEPTAPFDNNMVRQLCECISINQLDNYSTWIQLGMPLKKIGGPLELWEESNIKSNMFENYVCKNRWFKCKETNTLLVH